MAGQAPEPPRGTVAFVHKLSRYNVNHPDYAGMSSVEARRAIVRRLRACSISVIADEFKTDDRNKIRATVQAPATPNSPGTYHRAQADGIVWCRAFGLWRETFRDTDNFILMGSPVIFDVYSGNAVAPYPYTSHTNSGSSRYDREWNDDEFFIVGKAVGSAVKIKDADVPANEEWMVPVQLIPHNPVDDLYSKSAWAIASPIAGADHPIFQPDYTGNPRYRRNYPPQHTWYSYALDPSIEFGKPSWCDMAIIGLPQYSTQANFNESLWYKKEGYYWTQEASHARVLNYGPFGYKAADGGQIVVRKCGDVYIAERPFYPMNQPVAKIKFSYSVSGTSTSITITPSTSGATMTLEGNNIVGEMTSPTRKFLYLPNQNVRYKMTLDMVYWSKDSYFNPVALPVQITPFGTFVSTWTAKPESSTDFTKVRTPNPAGGYYAGDFYSQNSDFFGAGGTITVGPLMHSHTSDIMTPSGWSPSNESTREVKITIPTGGRENFACNGQILIEPVFSY